MSVADFRPFDVAAPSWGTATPAEPVYCQDADVHRQHRAAPESGGKPPVFAAAPSPTDATDATDAPAADWQIGIASLLARPRPLWASRGRWGRLRSALISVRDGWGQVALDAGWSPLDVFGCNPDPQAGRVDRDGLLASLAGHLAAVTVSAIYPQHADFRDERGTILRKRLPIAPGGVMIWEAYRSASGP